MVTLYLSSIPDPESLLISKAATKLDWNIEYINTYDIQSFNILTEKTIFGSKDFVEKNLEKLKITLSDLPVIEKINIEYDIYFKCFIFDNKVKTFSPYKSHNTITDKISEKYWFKGEEYANQIARKYSGAYVIDIGAVGNNFSITDVTQPCWSKIYFCDPIQALKTIKESCINNGSRFHNM